MSRWALAVASLAALPAAGCMSQTEKDDIANLCFAVERAGVAGEKDVSVKAQKTALYLRSALKTEKWQSFMRNASGMDPAKRTLEMRKAADAAGLKQCPLLDQQ